MEADGTTTYSRSIRRKPRRRVSVSLRMRWTPSVRRPRRPGRGDSRGSRRRGTRLLVAETKRINKPKIKFPSLFFSCFFLLLLLLLLWLPSLSGSPVRFLCGVRAGSLCILLRGMERGGSTMVGRSVGLVGRKNLKYKKRQFGFFSNKRTKFNEWVSGLV